MGLRGPKPSGHLSLTEKSQPAPPKRLGKIGKAMWKQIVNSYQPGHFRRAELPLLEKYCVCEQIYWQAMDKVNELITITDSGYPVQNAYLAIANAQVKLQSALATKLRITTNSRVTGSKVEHEKEPITNSRNGLMFTRKERW